MTLTAVMAFPLLVLLLQVAAAPGPDVYHRPAVAPYEPPSAFGRRAVEGDTDASPERLRGLRSAWSADYAAEVRAAERAGDAAMGPLDGEWRIEARGRALATLILSDDGSGHAQGAWTAEAGPSRPAAPVAATRDGDAWVLSGDLDGRAVQLILTPDGAGGWSGTGRDGGRDLAVALRRAG